MSLVKFDSRGTAYHQNVEMHLNYTHIIFVFIIKSNGLIVRNIHLFLFLD
jgi:hypothetical protein